MTQFVHNQCVSFIGITSLYYQNIDHSDYLGLLVKLIFQIEVEINMVYKSYFSIVHFRRNTSIYQPKNAHIISHKTHLKHFKTLRHVSILPDHHKGALFLAKVILQYSQFNSYLQTKCCGSISRCVGMCCGAVARCVSYDAHIATAPQHNNTTPRSQVTIEL